MVCSIVKPEAIIFTAEKSLLDGRGETVQGRAKTGQFQKTPAQDSHEEITGTSQDEESSPCFIPDISSTSQAYHQSPKEIDAA